MEEFEDKSKRTKRQAYYLLTGAAVFGLLSTLRMLGTGEVTLAAALLLAGAALLGTLALLGLFHQGSLPRERKKTIITVIFGIHLIATLFFFPPEDILNDRPVLTLDHSFHYYQAVRARAVFWDSFRFHTYDPFFMAGYPGGTLFDIDVKGLGLWCSLLRFLSVARSFKLFILLAYLSMVFTIYGGCRRLGFRFEEAVFSTLICLAYWHWGRPYAAQFRFAGMISFIFISHLSLYLVGLFRSLLDEEPAKRFYIFGPLAFFIHPMVAVLLPIPFITLFLIRRRFVPAGRPHSVWEKTLLFRLIGWCLLVIGINAIWLLPFFRYLDIKTSTDLFFQISGIRGMILVLLRPGNLPALLLIGLSIVGLSSLLKERRLTEAVTPAAAAGFLLFLTCFGIHIPGFDQMEPGRFLFSAFFFLAPLSGTGFDAACRRSTKLFRDPRLLVPAKNAALLCLFFCPLIFALVGSRAYYKHTITTTPTPEVEALLDALVRHTDSSGRLMIEDAPARVYGDCYLPSIIPLFTGVEQIGGPYPTTFIKHHFSTFQLDYTMGSTLEQLEPGKLFAYMELYNIHWVLAATESAKAYFEGRQFLEPVWSSRHFVLWKVSPDWFFASEPGVSVRAAYDHIQVSITPDAGYPPPDSILVKYHWDRGLRASPPAKVSQTIRLEDPVPLILLEPNGATDIQIFFR